MIDIVRAAKEEGVTYKEAPYKMPVRRLDDVKAARELNLAYRPD
jgi:glycine dehydrogenase subunit 2